MRFKIEHAESDHTWFEDDLTETMQQKLFDEGCNITEITESEDGEQE